VSSKFHIGAVLFIVLALGFFNTLPAWSQDVEISVSPDQDFSTFQTYRWSENMIAPAQSEDERIKTEGWVVDAVNRELQKKGYVEDSADPDFSITVRAMSMYGDTVKSANLDSRMPGGGVIYESNRPMGPGVSVWLTLIAGARITVTDTTSGEVAWEATVTKKYKDPNKLKNNLKKEIDKVFEKGMKKFPSSKNGK
jgi:hypothetical protein